jgi:P27 family predicted phage terminase small subunit
MGLRGRAPKPRAIRELEGISKPYQLNQNEPRPRVCSLEPPVPLNPNQRLVWDALAPEMVRIGTLTLVDVPAFLRYIDLTLEYNEMQRQIAGQNYFFIIRGEDGKAKYISTLPAVTIRNQALANLLKLEAQFGMTPSSRTRVTSALNGEEANTDDPLGLRD